jgi:predicted ribosome quality control (RQC) complex YloA/Tae2 family protein
MHRRATINALDHIMCPVGRHFLADGTPLFVGRDKYENEDLIKWGWPEDVWFHVDNLSSPHVYVRLPPVRVLSRLLVQLSCLAYRVTYLGE